jgi:antitoxin component YwqK of YwqJK toxin-antitoxin module
MPKLRIKRSYYRNDRVRAEIREVAGQFHGFNRSWHFNGRLAEELYYRRVLLYGTSRQWDENGRLLGSFSMNHGTGRQRYWHQYGRLRLEINSFNGKFFGRMRLWLRDGTLVQETYYISNVDVTRAAYSRSNVMSSVIILPIYGRTREKGTDYFTTMRRFELMELVIRLPANLPAAEF